MLTVYIYIYNVLIKLYQTICMTAYQQVDMSLQESGYTPNALTEGFHMPSIQDGWNFRLAWILISYNCIKLLHNPSISSRQS